MTKHALITGGTGFIGKPLCRSLITQGYVLTVLSRNAKKASSLLGKEVRIVTSFDDIEDETVFDVVINLSGESIAQRWTETVKQKILDSRVGVTKGLNDLFSRLKTKPKVLISGSAIGWYGTDDNLTFNEYSNPSDHDRSFARHVCAEWEKEAF